MEGSIWHISEYGRRCDTGAASGQSMCGQTSGEDCRMDTAGQCGFSSGPSRESGYCDAGAASGQSACGQAGDYDECCCC
jgi:hypothetical protein